jgi:hypothetical protein
MTSKGRYEAVIGLLMQAHRNRVTELENADKCWSLRLEFFITTVVLLCLLVVLLCGVFY